MGILKNAVLYAPVWTEDYRVRFDEEDLNAITEIEVVASNYGISARVALPDGNAYYPIHRDSSKLAVGDHLDKNLCTIIHLKRGDQETEKLLYTGDPL